MSQKFKSDIETQAGLIDSFGFSGSAGQILSSTGTKTEWITPPQSPGGGGSSQVFYFNGGVASSVGGYYQMSPVANTSTGADFTINANGYIASFLTDINSPNQLNIPAGNWNFEIYFNASSGGGSPSFYVELYKYSSSTFTLIASSSATPEGITNGTAIDLYITALAVPTTTLLATDRLAVRVYVTHSGRTIKMHTQNGHLSEVITTFSTGLTALNGLTEQVQYFATGAGGTDFNIASAVNTHTFNLPTASATNRGALSSADWITFNSKANASGTTNYVSKFTGTTTLGNSLLFDNGTNVGLGTTTPGAKLDVSSGNINLSNSFNLTARNNANTFNIALIGRSSTDRVIIDADGYGTNIGGGGTVLINPSGGNVGIGTTSPIHPLSVVGRIGGNIFGDSHIEFLSNGNTSLKANNSVLIGYSQNTVITQSGNVGIGTASPSAKLHVEGNATPGNYAAYINNASGGGNVLKLYNHDWDVTDYLLHATNGGSYSFVIDGNGKVGIGTTSPSQKLEVSGIGYASSDFRAPIFYDSNNTAYYLDPNSNSNIATLTLNGNDNQLNINAPSSGAAGIFYRENGNNKWETYHYNGAFRFYNYTTAQEELSLDNSGGFLTARTSMRAPIFYDSNDTGYYLNPASTSNLYTVNATNYLVTPLIYSGGGNVSFGNDLQLSGNYLRFDENGVRSWNQRATGGNLVLNSGDGNGNLVVNGNAIIHSGNIGSQSVSYATTAGSAVETDTLQTVTGRGNTTSNGLIATASEGREVSTYFPSSYGLNDLVSGHNYKWYSDTWRLGATRSGGMAAADFVIQFNGSNRINLSTSGNLTASADMRAPIFYDSDNTGYYINPASTSVFNGLTVAGYELVRARTQGNWAGSGVIDNVVGLLTWKNYGSAHVIFDASNGTTPSGTACSSSDPQNNWTGTYPTLMGWNGNNTYGVRVDSARVADSVGSVSWSSITGKPSNIFYYQGFTLDANTMDANASGFTYAVNAPFTGPIARFATNGNYDMWINSPYSEGGYGFAFRTRNGDTATLNPWRYPAVYDVNANGGGVLYATVYYDQNNTAYYIDANNTSNLNVLQANRYVSYSANNTGGLALNNGSTYWGLVYNNSANDWRLGYGASNSAIGWNLRWDDGGTTWANSSMRAPIFYDSDNTAYYLDAASTSSLNGLQLASYSSANNGFQAFKNIGTITPSWPETNHTLGLENTDAGYLVLNFHRAGYTSNNLVYDGSLFSFDLSTRSSADFRAPVFYDSDNTGYYINPASSTTSINVAGNIDLIARSAGWSEGIRVRVPSTSTWGGIRFTRDRVNDDGNWAIGFTGIDATDDLTFWKNNAGSEAMAMRLTKDSVLTVNGDVRSPIFYDSNNTGFYVNPAGTSSVSRVFYNNYLISQNSGGLMGDYNINGTAAKCIWTIGESWPLVNMYGLAYEYDGTYFHSISLKWDGVTYSRLGLGSHGSFFTGAVTSGTSFKAPIFYDSNDTSFYFDGSNTGDSIRCAGDIVAYYSDERLKDKKGNIENALEKVLSLNGFYYEPNEVAQELGYKKRLEVGVSAQEVEAVLPELIKDAPIGQGYKTLDYGKLTPLLIEAVKEQQIQISEQQKQIEELKELVNKLINK